MKKIKCISILLSFLLMFAVCTPVFAEESAQAETPASNILTEEEAKMIRENLEGLANGYNERYKDMLKNQKKAAKAADDEMLKNSSGKADFTAFYDQIMKKLAEIEAGIKYTSLEEIIMVGAIDILGNALYYAETVTKENGEIDYQLTNLSKSLIGSVTLQSVLFSEEYNVKANAYIVALRAYKAIEEPTSEDIDSVKILLTEIETFLNSQKSYIVRDIATESIQMTAYYKELLSALPESVGKETAFNYTGMGAITYNALLDQIENVTKLSNEILAPEVVTQEVYDNLATLKDHPYGWASWNNAWIALTDKVVKNAEAAIKDAAEKGYSEKNIAAYRKALEEFKTAYANKKYADTSKLAVMLKGDVKTFGNPPTPVEGTGGNTTANAATNVSVQEVAAKNPGTGSNRASGILGVVVLCGIGIGALYLRKKHSL